MSHREKKSPAGYNPEGWLAAKAIEATVDEKSMCDADLSSGTQTSQNQYTDQAKF